MTSRYSSHAIARQADLTLLPSRKQGLVRQQGPWLHVGPGASDDAIVSIACRRLLLRERGVSDEESVREQVRNLGYQYVAPTKTHPELPVFARNDRSERPIQKRRTVSR